MRRSQTSERNFTTILSFTLLKIEPYLPGVGIKTWLTGSSIMTGEKLLAVEKKAQVGKIQ